MKSCTAMSQMNIPYSLLLMKSKMSCSNFSSMIRSLTKNRKNELESELASLLACWKKWSTQQVHTVDSKYLFITLTLASQHLWCGQRRQLYIKVDCATKLMSQVSFLHFGLSGILSPKKICDVKTFPLKQIDFTTTFY